MDPSYLDVKRKRGQQKKLFRAACGQIGARVVLKVEWHLNHKAYRRVATEFLKAHNVHVSINRCPRQLQFYDKV